MLLGNLLPLLSCTLAAALWQQPALPDWPQDWWRFTLQTPGGELPFLVEWKTDSDAARAWIHNGPERWPIGGLQRDAAGLILDMEPYDSHILLSWTEKGKAMTGVWRKRLDRERWQVLLCRAESISEPSATARFRPLAEEESDHSLPLASKWKVQFQKADQAAVALFQEGAGGQVTGTFMTTLGDYRYLAGRRDGHQLRLSCFDGSHAFLFQAERSTDGSLQGDFWSGDRWHETWSAKPDPQAKLEDAFQATKVEGAVDWRQLQFPDLNGKLRKLGETEFPVKATVLQIFGSWCPNCHDETKLLVELDRRYRSQGLQILALAFERTGDPALDRPQLQRYRRIHQVEYPTLLAGTADKAAASRALPFLDRIRAFPTTVFIDQDGRIQAVHSGFAGPATGEAHQRLRTKFESIIVRLLQSQGQSK
ncbi:MAG: TlpA family protein disulfide reductase [Planctomycetota bacterium]|nr:MAG: TlpA family protein disulfide reductase [Planctomycetota bacterium]